MRVVSALIRASSELACSGIKHDLDLPTPFGAIDAKAYREYGAEYVAEWATKTFGEFDG